MSNREDLGGVDWVWAREGATMGEPENKRKGWRALLPGPPKDEKAARGLAVATVALSLGNWPVQAFLCAGAIPPSHVSGLGAVSSALMPILFVAPVFLFGAQGLAAKVGSGWLKVVNGIAMVIAVVPALMALCSAGLLLAQF
jgi:hypothetical protein